MPTPEWQARRDAWAEYDRLRQEALVAQVMMRVAKRRAEELGPRPISEPTGLRDFLEGN